MADVSRSPPISRGRGLARRFRSKFGFPVVSPFRLRVSHYLDHATFPAPATSNAACGFPALRSPICFMSCKSSDAFVISSLPSPMLETLQMAGPLRSTDITPLHRYYGPVRHPLVFGRLPGFAGYTAYLAPAISRWDEEGLSSCSACPCHRAVASTPPR